MTHVTPGTEPEMKAPYFRWLFGGVLMTLLLASAVNVIVDPYNVFDLVSVDGFNRGKPAVVNRSGFAKTYMVERARANTVIVGASRVDVGLDPLYPAWPEHLRPVFNFGVPGSGVYDHLRYLQHATATHRPRLAVVSLDFGQFLDLADLPPRSYPPAPKEFERRLAVTYQNRRTPLLHLGRARDAAASLMSTTALIDSARTIANQHYSSPTALGFSSGPERFASEVWNKGSYSVMRDVTRKTATRLASGVAFEPDPNASFGFQAFRDLLSFSREQSIQLILIIPPSHVFEYELWDLFGFWEDFERWKLMILDEIEASNQREDSRPKSTPTPDVVLWDFSGYSPENAEIVPLPGDTKHPMRWFWEPIHFTSGLGGLIISSITLVNPSAYGKVLSSTELCDQLSRDRVARSQYRRDNQVQIAMLNEILGEDMLAEAQTIKRGQNSKAPMCGE